MNNKPAIEVEVHTALRDYIRACGNRGWPHHLTMARLVARALKLGRSGLLQTESSFHKYCMGYLMPVLISDFPVIIVAPEDVLIRLQEQEIPKLSHWLGVEKQVSFDNLWQAKSQVSLMTPQSWLQALGIGQGSSALANLPNHIPTIIDSAGDLEEWTRSALTVTIGQQEWLELIQINSFQPELQESVRKLKVQLTKSIFARPTNRYECFLFDPQELRLIEQVSRSLTQSGKLTPKFEQFHHAVSYRPSKSRTKISQHYLIWGERDRTTGMFTISFAPGEVAATLQPIWERQPVVLVGSFLDREPKAEIYRQKLGLPEMLAVKFSPNQQQDWIRLFIPDRFPLANTPEYSPAINEKINTLVGFSQNNLKFTVILVEDVPLRGQVASNLAAKYGTTVKVDTIDVSEQGILVCGWQFWKRQQDYLPTPELLIMTTLPLPSLEHPLVASRVELYKYRRQDWFRLYLLPTALKQIQQAIVPVSESQGIVALLDSRVNFRSYGKTILSVLEPCARINYIDPTWFLS